MAKFASEYGAPKVEDLLIYVGYGKLAGPRRLGLVADFLGLVAPLVGFLQQRLLAGRVLLERWPAPAAAGSCR